MQSNPPNQLPDFLTNDSFAVPDLSILTLTVQQTDDLRLPEHMGSMLRGAFGTAFRQLCCIMQLPACKDCPVKQVCAFPQLFEITALQPAQSAHWHNATNPYVIDTPTIKPTQGKLKAGMTWQFGMTLIGQAVQHLPLVKQAWQLALKQGLGQHPPYAKATLIGLQVENLNCDADTISQQLPALQLSKASNIKAILKFITPFRSQKHGKIANNAKNFDPEALLVSLYHRVNMCGLFLSSGRDFSMNYTDIEALRADLASLRFHTDVFPAHIARRSSRQQRKMTLFALQGTITIIAIDDKGRQAMTRLLPLLKVGEYLHVGKSASMGFGRYQLTVACEL